MELEIKSKRRYRKYANPQRLKYILLSDEQVITEIKKRIKYILQLNENKTTAHLNIWGTTKRVQIGC